MALTMRNVYTTLAIGSLLLSFAYLVEGNHSAATFHVSMAILMRQCRGE